MSTNKLVEIALSGGAVTGTDVYDASVSSVPGIMPYNTIQENLSARNAFGKVVLPLGTSTVENLDTGDFCGGVIEGRGSGLLVSSLQNGTLHAPSHANQGPISRIIHARSSLTNPLWNVYGRELEFRDFLCQGQAYDGVGTKPDKCFYAINSPSVGTGKHKFYNVNAHGFDIGWDWSVVGGTNVDLTRWYNCYSINNRSGWRFSDNACKGHYLEGCQHHYGSVANNNFCEILGGGPIQMNACYMGFGGHCLRFNVTDPDVGRNNGMYLNTNMVVDATHADTGHWKAVTCEDTVGTNNMIACIVFDGLQLGFSNAYDTYQAAGEFCGTLRGRTLLIFRNCFISAPWNDAFRFLDTDTYPCAFHWENCLLHSQTSLSGMIDNSASSGQCYYSGWGNYRMETMAPITDVYTPTLIDLT